ncbi:MAG: hypothetical protein WAM81_01550 [Acidimicrobiia bacterium]
MRRLLLLALVVLTASCVPITTDTTPVSTALPTTVPTTTIAPAATSTTATTTPEDAIRAQVDDLIAETEKVRELTFLTPPTVTIVDETELADRVRGLIAENVDPDQIARDTALEVLLGLVPEGTDMLTLYQDLYGEQVLGFYDGETKEMVVPATGAELSAAEKVTLVHELTHALTDQHYSFSDRSDALDEGQRYDALSALQTITEGDATLTELHYVAGLPSAEQQAVIADSLGQDTGVFDTAPKFIQQLLVFPYNAGLSLLNGLWTPQDGFRQIDEAYVDPPTTTEQVMHADKYADREPAVEVQLPDTPIDGYATVEESSWGELLFNVMFAQILGQETADAAAGGWGGDSYRLMWDGTNVVFVLHYVGDTEQDAQEMQTALADYVTTGMGLRADKGGRFTGDSYAFVARNGADVLFIAAGDRQAGETARAAFPDF